MSGDSHQKLDFVPRWNGTPLSAAGVRVGVCGPAVAIDMAAMSGQVFAHGHFDVATAEVFHKAFGLAIAQARAVGSPEGQG